MFVFLDTRYTLSYVSTYFVFIFDMMFDSILIPICVSTRVGESSVVNLVYRSYFVSLVGYHT